MTLGKTVNLEQYEHLLEWAKFHTDKILTDGEISLATTVQQKPVVNLHPHSITVTNKRVIKHQPHLFKATFQDFLWRDIVSVHLADHFFGSQIYFEFKSGHIMGTHLPKNQAKKVYSIAQEKEEEWVEKRRIRKMEEVRAQSGANHIVVGGNKEFQRVDSDGGVSIRERLVDLQELLVDGLITQDEYQTKKAEILKRI
jgi:hypothetical protein